MAKRKDFYIRIDGKLVSVTEEVYLAYYRMGEHERYLERKDRLKGKVLYSDMDTDNMLGEEAIPDFTDRVEEIAICNIMAEKLLNCLAKLSETEQELIKSIFFDGHSERELSALTGVPRKTIGERRVRVLKKLKKLLES